MGKSANGWWPWGRGNDGLTRRERAESARRWREGAGRMPTVEEFERAMELAERARRERAVERWEDCTCEPGVMEAVPPINGCPVHE